MSTIIIQYYSARISGHVLRHGFLFSRFCYLVWCGSPKRGLYVRNVRPAAWGIFEDL